MTTRGDLLNAEIACVKAKHGYYIPLYFMAEMMKTANKIVNLSTHAIMTELFWKANPAEAG